MAGWNTREQRRIYTRQYRADRLRLGLCVSCKARVEVMGQWQCARHAAECRAYKREWYARRNKKLQIGGKNA